MFEGTLRDNLDPRHAHVDTELWSVLGMSSAGYTEYKAADLCRTCQIEGLCRQYGRSIGFPNSRRG